MQRRRAPRRLAALATAVAAVAAATAPAAAATGPRGAAGGRPPAAMQRGEPGQRPPPHVSVVITKVDPQFAQPGSTVTVSGVVVNPTGTPLPGLSVALWSSGFPLAGRDSMSAYLTTPAPTEAGTQEGTPTPVFALAAHSSRTWSLKLSPAQAGMSVFGVYPLAAQLSGPSGRMSSARTFLPFWPGKPERRLLKPLSIAWVWPLIDVPQQVACRAVGNGGLAASLASGGRLSRLLAAGSTPTALQADLTWAIDPALLSDAALMTHGYRVGASPTCSGGTAKPPSRAARSWLSGLRSVAARQDYFVTPYADVDVAALAYRGLDGNLASAFSSGRSAATSTVFDTGRGGAGSGILSRFQRTTPALAAQIAWPPDGMADYGALEDLAVNHVGTVILDGNMMPPDPQVPYTPSAVTTTSAAASRLHVLLADHTLARILAAPAGEIPGAVPAPSPAPGSQQLSHAATFTKEQWFLAETAMIASELPGTARSVVITPPRRWDPPRGMAGTLLSESVHAPWLRPATLAGLVTARHPTGGVPRRQPPGHRLSYGELRGSLLNQIRSLTGQIHVLASILPTAGKDYLARALAAIESSAWRGGRASQRRAQQQLRRVSTYVRSQLQQVTIVNSPHVTLGGKSGSVPVSVRNQLNRVITVRVIVHDASPGRVVIGQFHDVVTVPAGTQHLIKIPVRSAAAGTSTLLLQLATPDGRALPGPPSSLVVEATHFGTLAIVIIVVALGVFLVTAAARAIRRGAEPSGDDTGGDGVPPGDGHEEGEPPENGQTARVGPDPASGGEEAGSVVTSTAGQADPAKEADDHASTPGRARRL